LVEEDGGFDIAKTVFSDFAVAAFGNHRVHVAASDALCFRGFDAESFAVEIEIKATSCTIAPTNVVEGELFGKVAVRFGLKTVAEPIFARNGNFQESGTQVDEWDVEPASVEGDDCLVMFGDIPEGRQEFNLIHAWNEFDGAGFAGVFFEVRRGEEDLAA